MALSVEFIMLEYAKCVLPGTRLFRRGTFLLSRIVQPLIRSGLAIFLSVVLTSASQAFAADPPMASGQIGGEQTALLASPDFNDSVAVAETSRRAHKLEGLTLVTDQVLERPPGADWLLWRRTYDGQGFSPLRQINTRNARRLSQAWSWTLPNSSNEITPLVHEGVMFIYSGGRVQALDAAGGDLLWSYSRPLAPSQGGSSAILRGLAIYRDQVFFAAPDGHLVALNMRSGKVGTISTSVAMCGIWTGRSSERSWT